MKRISVFVVLFCLLSCNNTGISKPDKLIEKDKMIDVLYDISLLESIKTQNINGGLSTKSSNEYIFKKYSIDSIQFSNSNKYYASDVDEYKKIFDEVKERLKKESDKIDKKMGVTPASNGVNTQDNSKPTVY